MSADEPEEYYEEQPIYFTDCTCEHKPEEHGWGHCDVKDCPCEGGYEE